MHSQVEKTLWQRTRFKFFYETIYDKRFQKLVFMSYSYSSGTLTIQLYDILPSLEKIVKKIPRNKYQ